MLTTVHINTSKPYDVLIGRGLMEKVGELTKQVIAPCTAAIITDTTVDALYGAKVEKSYRDAGYATLRYAFPAGEQNKNWETLGGILEYLAENHLTRSDVIIALGGGVPGDMAGFAAAVYARGIRFVQIPTTLLASVDSSVGGKTAVDLRAGKNLAGSFHQPCLVITDTDVICDLPAQQISDGSAEVIKYGVLYDEELFGWMCEANWMDRIDEIIAKCVDFKRKVVSEDEFDNGSRTFLNLGHTFGHAIEKCAGFGITHGQGVAMGMCIAAGAADRKDICSKIIKANQNCGLPCLPDYDAQMLADAALSDKKRKGQNITLVLPEAIGKCYLKKISVDELEDAFAKGLSMTEALL